MFVKHNVFDIVQSKYTHLERDNIGLTLLLSFKKDPKIKICISNTHLLFNPKRHEIRLRQYEALHNEAKKLMSEFSTVQIPSILCGDFNMTPFSDTFRSIVKEYMTSTSPRHPLNGKNFRTFLGNENKIVDYIFYKHAKTMKPISFLSPIVDEGCHSLAPNNYHPSDHCFMATNFGISENTDPTYDWDMYDFSIPNSQSEKPKKTTITEQIVDESVTVTNTLSFSNADDVQIKFNNTFVKRRKFTRKKKKIILE
ncbi:hypothetical protein HK099_007056 [Clydaea vesicula]|uniref:Endonuclease/exonuclease/phosphatase domain-containing protein n=1 Tax=Clydaea vesicula TaxID=447962 RepID=A0AAD5XWL8_9FUNG|nr:hypothetical protein HK099_007056 [Clydaea vesicula]